MIRDRLWTLVGPDGRRWRSPEPGTLGGHRGSRIYGRLDCRAALRAIAKGGYVTHRVFFFDATHARAAGFRPCAVCLPAEYAQWRRDGSALLLSAKCTLCGDQSEPRDTF
jgi:methylphosphotriester-DNA--protein-cysteine methyltransferase